ncbi:MAG: VWA domain-containing protein [Ignavibacteria bacterium]|nr:VWA domain-containing protein [Ignavibacteria bacterium]
MKTCFYFLISLMVLYTSPAQTLSVFGAKVTNFPKVTAAFYARDAQGKRLNSLSNTDFSVIENSAQRNVLSVTCPPDSPPVMISSVLVVDVSGSMGGQNIVIGRAAAHSWINNLPADGSECAVTSFDGFSYINQDFTTNKKFLSSAVDALKPSGGTNYNAGFITGQGSAFEVIQRAKFKRIVVFLTDGMGSITEQDVLDKAKAVNAVVYCVGVNLKLPDALKILPNKQVVHGLKTLHRLQV